MRSFLLFLLLFFWSTFTPVLRAQDDKAKAERIAQKVLKASGGKKEWKNTRYFHWNFFGVRDLWWDKKDHRVRIEWPEKELTLVADLDAMKGKIWKDSVQVTDSAKKAKLLETARRIWINDSYWLFMPFKMSDPGVHLKYLGSDTLDGNPMHKVRMTFEEVGVTPQNKYHVWVDRKDHLVRKWAYFRKRDDQEPSMVTPWKGYSTYNGLKLSSDRGEKKIQDISVPRTFPKGTFNALDP
ncbi:MAG: hypothetical protein ABEH38_07875 [Flavobacteriales bacterium]